MPYMFRVLYCVILCGMLFCISCSFYRFSSASIPPEITTIYIDQVAMQTDFVDVEFGPAFTQRFIDLTNNRTRLTVQTNIDGADWVLSGFVSRYETQLEGNAEEQATQTTLNISLDFTLLDNVNEDTKTFNISDKYVASGEQTIFDMQDEARGDIIQRLADNLFNNIYANW